MLLLAARCCAAAPSKLGHDCPDELRVSSSAPMPPRPDQLAYRSTSRTGSISDGLHYSSFALQASMEDSVFATFRQEYMRNRFAGIESDGRMKWNSRMFALHVEKMLNMVGRADLLERALPIIMELDRIGMGSTFALADNRTHVSGLMLRYLAKVADIEQMFGNLDGMHLIEIGVGYGGFGALIMRLHPRIASYTFVDLPEVLNLVNRYVITAKVEPKLRFLNAAPCTISESNFVTRARGYDLAISMYAFAEVPTNVRLAYFATIIARSQRGWISDTWTRGGNKSLLLPVLLRSSGPESAAAVAANRTVILPDLIGGPTPYGYAQAQVGWGVTHDYFPALVHQMRTAMPRSWARWVYAVRKLSLAEPFKCVTPHPEKYGPICTNR